MAAASAAPGELAHLAGAYEHEFALAASAEVMAVVSLGLMLAVIMPTVPWAVVATTTAPSNKTGNATLSVYHQQVSLWADACSTPGMVYTYASATCQSALASVAAFAVLAVFFEAMAVTFGIMPFSTVAPRTPKVALTHAMMSQMMASLFSLLSWAVFYGSLVHTVWANPNEVVKMSSEWSPYVLVTGGGVVCVAAWVASFFGWTLALSAMIKYDTSAAEQAIVDHALRKEEAARRRLEIIAKLGEGAARAAREGISLELGDKLFLGGTISAGAVTGVAWANLGLVQYLIADPRSQPAIAGVLMIINVVASTTATLVLMCGLTDLLSRVKAAVGGFAVLAVVSAIWLINFGMAVNYLQTQQKWLSAYEIAVGAIGIMFSIGTTGVLFHPMKIWDKLLFELPRPAKIFPGPNGKALAVTSGMFSLFGFGLTCAALPIFLYLPPQFVGYVPTLAPSGTFAPTSSSCSNGLGATCNLGNATSRCCQPPLVCTEVAFTIFTCQQDPFVYPVEPRTSYGVGQGFLALTLCFSILAFIFSMIALAPNGVMDAKVSLTVSMSTSLAAFSCGVIAFSVLQAFVVSSNGTGVPVENGFLIGGFVSNLVSALTCAAAWLPLYMNEAQNELSRLHGEIELERARISYLELQQRRIALEAASGVTAKPTNVLAENNSNEATTITLAGGEAAAATNSVTTSSVTPGPAAVATSPAPASSAIATPPPKQAAGNNGGGGVGSETNEERTLAKV